MSETPERPIVLDAPIAAEDEMFDGDVGRYEHVGADAVVAVRRALDAAGRTGAERILDLPCGHGRVLRHLRRAFPGAELTACDLSRDGVDFCARAFGARPVYSSERIAEVDLGATFDLIWCGSLLTHLDRAAWLDVWRLFVGSLEPGGVLVLTTHGRWVADVLRSGARDYQLAPEAVAEVIAGYDAEGFGYADYASMTGYGISVCTPGWLMNNLEQQMALRIVSFTELGWDAHQDVVGLQKLALADD